MVEVALDPGILARIESQCGSSLTGASPDSVRFLVSNSKAAGNKCFKDKNYKGTTSDVVVQASGRSLRPQPIQAELYDLDARTTMLPSLE